ncbi:MAG: GFA family protein [Pseudomonadota bacterium]
MTDLPAEGRCSCGAVTYTISASPLFALYCHCSACQKRCGAAFLPVMFVPEAAFEVSGETDTTTRTGGSGNPLTSHRCKVCGQNVYNEVGVLEGGVSVAPNTLDDPALFQPYCHIHTENTPDWLTLDDGLPQYAGPPETLPPGTVINR